MADYTKPRTTVCTRCRNTIKFWGSGPVMCRRCGLYLGSTEPLFKRRPKSQRVGFLDGCYASFLILGTIFTIALIAAACQAIG
ncbi:hypothetical protein [Streptomyces hirsutus]|uniref:hypothetical protein n=1 Tax=Streptomyces hirsutus TaxID=35620 RepID=UPI003684CB9A